ncbi:uncharacterized protein [Lepisosteus oculatus]|uniref:uncharacterized protein isoform X2 n=1 Tax=Lepisosteus oculatus TaxID=7918 RepID=UPI0007400AE9|nr:PREDICTED: uncharacterized protein LOC107077666 isoform X2 [Lepisosteus oculatus]
MFALQLQNINAMLYIKGFSFWMVLLFSVTEYVGTEEKKIAHGQLRSVVFLHPSTPKNLSEATWKKENILVGKFKNGISHPSYKYKNRAEIFRNGTLKLNCIVKEDFGVYFLELYDKTGKNIFKDNITLKIGLQTFINISCPISGNDDENTTKRARGLLFIWVGIHVTVVILSYIILNLRKKLGKKRKEGNRELHFHLNQPREAEGHAHRLEGLPEFHSSFFHEARHDSTTEEEDIYV